MATIAELRARLSQLNRRTSKNSDIWKPKDEHDARLVRNPHSADPFEEVAFHYNLGDVREILCPKQWGDECAICDFAETLKAWKDKDGNDRPEKERKADFEIFRKIQSTTKVYSPMVERIKDDKGNVTGVSQPAWWGLTSNQAQQALKVCSDPKRLRACDIDPTDDTKALDALFSSSKAFDLHVSYQKPLNADGKGNTKNITNVLIEPDYLPSPLTGDPKKDAEILKAIKPIREVFPKVTQKEVEEALRKFIGGGMKVENARTEPEKKDEKYPPKTKAKAAEVGTRTIEESFGDLLDETSGK